MSVETKTIELTEHADGRILEVDVSGKLTKADYEAFGPRVEELMKQHGKIRILFRMHDFHGWTVGGLWEDLKFDLQHFRDIERLAVVGEKRWEQAMATVCKPFPSAEIKYFDVSEADQALQWLQHDY